MTRPSAGRLIGFVAAALVSGCCFGAAQAADIKVLSAGALRPLMQELAPDFEKASGNHLVLDFATAGGVEQRIAAGEPVDVAILTEPRIKTLEGDGKIAKESVALIGRAAIGLAVKKGVPHPDIGSVAGFRRTLLIARSIAYTDPASGGTSGIDIAKIFERLGIAGDLKAKLRPISGSAGEPPSVGGAVALGVAEIGLQPISELMGTPGIEIVGRLPAELQSPDLVYFAGIPAASAQPAPAKALVDFLAGFEAAPIIKSKGLEPR
jgi:molybdate transport system substrate-binding protein